ncbi:MAG TPA: hypothetical protein VK059_13325 [Nocardioidaceae bacterium]|nr:hypothetical protein [Nocardioidaceae bacterium]
MAAIRRLFVSAAALTLAASGLVLGAPAQASGAVGSAYSCSCAQVSLESLAEDADAVFVGTVDSQSTERGERVYSLRVSDVYSGSPGQTTTVRTPADDAECGMPLRLRRQYMVVGEQTKVHGDVSVTSCSGTRPISDRTIAAVERALGPATPYRGVPDRNGGQGNDDKNADGANGDAQSQGGSTGDTSGSRSDAHTATKESNQTQNENSTSKVVVGVLLALAIGAAFLLPRLRRRHRRGGSTSEE